MAMVKCKECKNEISDKAASCPKCGAKIVRTSLVTKMVSGIIGLLVVMWIFGSISASRERDRQAAAEQARINAMTPEQRAKEAAQRQASAAATAKENQLKEARFQHTVLVAQTIKKAMRNPDSFALDEASANDDGSVVCISYRGQNGFGAMSREFAVYAKGKLNQSAGSWNDNCAHKSLYDMNYVRRAL